MKTDLNPRFLEMDKDKNIVHTEGRYVVQKAFNYKNKQFGSYRTRKEAQKVRDALEESNWEKGPEYIKAKLSTETFQDLYIHNTEKGYRIIKNIDGKIHKYETFQDIEEARKKRNDYVLNNWYIEDKIIPF